MKDIVYTTNNMLQSEQVVETVRSALNQLKKINILVNGNVSRDGDHVRP